MINGRRRHYRILLVAAFSCVFLFSIAADQSVAQDSASTLRLVVQSDPHSLLPILETVRTESDIESLMFDDLIAFDHNNNPQPVLASAVPTSSNGGISPDGKVITVHLRRNITWHDGEPLTSADVVFTMNAILDPKNAVSNRSSYSVIDRVEAIDRFTVVFHLHERYAAFIANVCDGYPIIPAHLLEHSTGLATDPFNTQPIGTGPYRFVRWLRGDRILLSANPDYFLGPPKIAHVIVTIVPDTNTIAILLKQHLIDFAQVDSGTYQQMLGVPGLVRVLEPASDFTGFALNEAGPILRDKQVRLALIAAVDRAAIAQRVTFGTGTVAYADLPYEMYGGGPPHGWRPFDPALSTRLLDRAGWKLQADGTRSKGGVPLQLTLITYAGSAAADSVAVQLQQMLRQVGIGIDIKTYATSIYYAPAPGGPIRSGTYDLAAYTIVGSQDQTNSPLYSCAARIPAGFNAANYCSASMERLQSSAESEYDFTARSRLYGQIEDLAVRDATYLFLYHTPYRFVMSSKLTRPPTGSNAEWYGIADWQLSESPGTL